ncbi:RnfH family protein [Aquabacterium sp.]|uniref:RnfH family protein n=1 Tax=Aquabacterium sp. TaxID=1872578 RepID=UPI00198C30F5|nr:RnfH family protein [Aquabacterium sp.]MBC7701765.1 RnfH family protein [Aquabacterium sp.]
MGPVEQPPAPTIHIEVVFSAGPRQIELKALTLPLGSCVKDALLGSGLLAQAQGLSVGIWGRKTTLGHALQDRDRVEVCRDLIVDPKEARRVRYRAHGEKLSKKGVKRPQTRAVTEPSG